MTDVIGYSWLLNHYKVNVVQPLRRKSVIGATRQSRSDNGYETEVYTPNYRPDPRFDAHMTFALKYEGVNLEALARLFEVVPETVVAEWVNRERVGQYARRTGFLWEWFTDRKLTGVEPVPSGNYVDAIDKKFQLVATSSKNDRRWRVRDNIPGTRLFCPVVFHSEGVKAAAVYDCAKELEALNVEFGADVLLRSAVWLTIKESRASFLIEREEKHQDRIKRFAIAMEKYCGVLENPLGDEALALLQQEIIGKRTTLTHFGPRLSPIFVGSVANYEPVVHYVAPHWDALGGMLTGLEIFLARTQCASPILRAAVCSFSLVYIHPLADGNGRIHRFLINDILRRDGAVPEPYILPISATITQSPVERAHYDQILDVFSKPLMKQFSSACEFGRMKTYPDGIESDFEFVSYPTAAPTWRYPDLTSHVEYIADIIDKTIREEMTNEARILRDWDRARSAVKIVLDGPDRDIDRIIRSLRDNNGVVSNSLRKQFPVLEDSEVAGEVAVAVASVFGT